MHCFASENQTYTGTWLFGVESWKSLKGQENLLLKNLQVKTRVENVRFLSWRIFFVGKYGIQSTNEMAFKRTVTLRASFRFPAIRFDAPTLLSFSGFTHAHAKCPPVTRRNCHPCGFHLVETSKKRTGTAKKLSLSFPAPLPPLLSLPLYREPGTGHHAWKQLTIFSCLQVFSPKLRVFWFWLAGFFVFELRLFRFRTEDAWFFWNSRLLLFAIFRSLWYCIAFYKL